MPFKLNPAAASSAASQHDVGGQQCTLLS